MALARMFFFSQDVFHTIKDRYYHFLKFDFLSANAFYLIQSKIMSLSTELLRNWLTNVGEIG